MDRKALIIGASGQIGSELVSVLRKRIGNQNVVASDIKQPNDDSDLLNGPFEVLDVMNAELLKEVVEKHHITEVYLLAALLSATAEKKPMFAWQLNMDGLFNVLNLAKEKIIQKVFWPSSIAVFGPSSPKNQTPQVTVMEPTTVYGISKLAGERWCEYYHKQYDVDVRSIRYPGLISTKSLPGGGTTDYAVDIFYKAKKGEAFTCFLSEDTALPMMFMDDAINATLNLMEAAKEKLSVHSSYNVSSLSFSPRQLTEAIRHIKPNFEIVYQPDFRQAIADTWPASIDDEVARKDWGWEAKYGLDKMVKEMLEKIKA
ncbi:MAG: NAD-dependent epimerase/dehydratase family protein [Flavobacteriales bacterium]|jgi:nucleoside-diphosphate-sugar epimerase|nr:NAD-dependent epimerase/dehydratase family protein [Flavobacteriales bacterium]